MSEEPQHELVIKKKTGAEIKTDHKKLCSVLKCAVKLFKLFKSAYC